MKQQLYVIYDVIAEVSGPTFEAINDGVANRAFKMRVAQESVPYIVNETDFELYHIGEIDKTTNIINPYTPRMVITNISLIDEVDNAESV